MEGEQKPFPFNKHEEDFERLRTKATLSVHDFNNNNNRRLEKKYSQCWVTAFSPHSNLFAWSCGQRKVKIVPTQDICNNTLSNDYPTIDCRQVITSLVFIDLKAYRGQALTPAADGTDYRLLCWEEHDEVLAVGLRNGRIRVIDVHTGRILLELLDHTDNVSHLHFIPNQSLTLASASFDGTVKFWELADDGNMAGSLHPSDHTHSRGQHKVLSLAVSPDYERFTAVGTYKTVLICSVEGRQVLQKLHGHTNHVNCCDFGPDGVLLITASADTTTIIWNSHTGEIIFKLGHQYPPPSEWIPGDDDTNVLECKFTVDGTGAATVADDGFIRCWDLRKPCLPSAIDKIEEPLCCSFNPTGDLLAIGTAEGDVRVVCTPHHVLTLTQICRLAVNQIFVRNNKMINLLPIPVSLRRFLNYEYINP